MKNIMVLIFSVVFLSVASIGQAANDDLKGANAKAYEHADENAVFNRMGDWFATVGKSKEEKAQIKTERKAMRAKKRAEKKAGKMKSGVENEMGEKAKKSKKKMKDSKSALKGSKVEHKGSGMEHKGSY